MNYPLQTTWKVKKDKVSQFTGRVLWDLVQWNAFLLNSSDDYAFINRVYDAQLRLWQVNNGHRIP